MQSENLAIYQANTVKIDANNKDKKTDTRIGNREELFEFSQDIPFYEIIPSNFSDATRQLDEATQQKTESKVLSADEMVKESQSLNERVQKETGDSSGKDGHSEDSWIRQGISWYENKVGDTSEYDNLESERKKLVEDSKKFAADGVITKEEQQTYDADKQRLAEKYEIYAKDRAQTVNSVAVIASATTQVAATLALPTGGVLVGSVAGAIVDTAIRNGEENKGLGIEDVATIATKSAINYGAGKVAGALLETQVAKQIITKGTAASLSAGTKVFESTGNNLLRKTTEYCVKEGNSIIVKSTADAMGNSAGKVTSNMIDAYKNDTEYGATDALRDIRDTAIGSLVANITLKGAIPATKFIDRRVETLATYTTNKAGEKMGKVVDWSGKLTSNLLVHGARNTVMGATKTGEWNIGQGYLSAVGYKVGDYTSSRKGISGGTRKEQFNLSYTGYGKLLSNPKPNNQNYDNLTADYFPESNMVVDNFQLGMVQNAEFI